MRGRTDNVKTRDKWIAIIAVLIVAGAGLWAVLSGQNTGGSQKTQDMLNGRERLLLLDGTELTETTVSPGKGDGLRVIVWLENQELANLPFGEEHTLEVIQRSGWNKVRVTPEAVYMEDADCQGQDCVHMGQITRDNMETRVNREFIICLPHKVTVQVAEQN